MITKPHKLYQIPLQIKILIERGKQISDINQSLQQHILDGCFLEYAEEIIYKFNTSKTFHGNNHIIFVRDQTRWCSSFYLVHKSN